ncbi:hypothetical protein ACQKPB_07360 [Sphingomonas sp. NPDC085925]|uniref:hypothetical protein n=2 Tax=Sphingomonas TaxID=13687 RepID=UPI003D09314B
MRMLNAYEIDLVAGGWGTTGATLDGMILANGDEITVTGRRLGGFPDFGFSLRYTEPATDVNYFAGGGGGQPPAPPAGPALEIAKFVAELITKLPVDIYSQAEIAARNLTYYYRGGINGESVRPDSLNTVTTLNGVTIYQHTKSGNLYADRDGEGSVDTAIWYKPSTGMVGLDKDADGNPDQILGDVTP